MLGWLLAWPMARMAAGEAGSRRFTTISELRGAALSDDRLHWNVRLEGTICRADADADFYLLADGTGAVPVVLAPGEAPPGVGEQIRLEGECSLRRDGLGVMICPATTVDNDGLHDVLEKSGSVYLKAGPNPIHVRWFNSLGGGVLALDYQGPGLPRQPVPAAALRHRDPGGSSAGSLAEGLAYRCWLGEWDFLPSFRRLPTVSTGVVTNLDLSVRPRPASVGMEFSGYLNLPQEGLYTFYLQSDDGSSLAVGPGALLRTHLGSAAVPRPLVLSPGQELSEPQEFKLGVVEGEVVFVDRRGLSLRLDLRGGENPAMVDIVDAGGATWEILRGGRVRATGICQSRTTSEGRKVAGYFWVPGWQDIEVLDVAADRWELLPVSSAASLLESPNHGGPLVRLRGLAGAGAGGTFLLQDGETQVTVQMAGEVPRFGSPVEVLGVPERQARQLALKRACVRPAPGGRGSPGGELPLLTHIERVRELGSQEAGRAYPVRVRGVVTARFGTAMNFVIQDGGHGIYVTMVRGSARGPLELGDLCEVAGVTRAATWAPAIAAQRVDRLGVGTMPEPLKPSRDQVLNGSLDSQYIEIQGVVTEVEQTGVKLLTRVGRIDIDLAGKPVEEWRALLDSLVRIKGCVLAVYDRTSGLAISGKLRFIHPAISIDYFPSPDPFDAPARRIASLRAFDPQASPFQRVKVSGQFLPARGEFYCLQEGTNGMRFYPRKLMSLPAGAKVDVAGILDLNGFVPTLHEAVARQSGRGALPEPAVLGGADLLSSAHDGTWVQLDALLLNSSRDSGDHAWELRAENHVFRAYLGRDRGSLPPVPAGSRVRLQGTYIGKGGDWSSGQGISSFDLALNSPADVVVLERPSWWTPRRLLTLAGALGVILLLAVAWIRVLRRQVEERTRQLTEQIRARQAVEQQRAIEQERTRLARDLHDDLGGGLTEISMLGFLAADTGLPQQKKTGYLQQMTEKARELVAALDEIVWAVNPRYDSLASLAAYCSLYAQRFLGLAGLKCQLQVSDSLPDQPLDSNLRHGLFLAFKEALSNVVRHAEATEVRLRIEAPEDLLVSLTDNGRGLPAGDHAVDGMEGLENMKARLAGLGGSCNIESAAGRGTTVAFRVPLTERSHDQSCHSRG